MKRACAIPLLWSLCYCRCERRVGSAATARHRGSRDDRHRKHPDRRRIRLRARGGLPGVGPDRQPPARSHARGQLRLQLHPGVAGRRRLLQSSQHHVHRAGAALRQARADRRRHAATSTTSSSRPRSASCPRGPAGRGLACGWRRSCRSPATRADLASTRWTSMCRACSARPYPRFASSATSASASFRIRSKATARTMS